MAQPRTRTVAAVILFLGATGWSGCASHTPLLECDAFGNVTPFCGFQNPEDLVDLGPDWILVSQMTLAGTPGNLLAFRPADGTRRVLWPTGGMETPAEDTGTCSPPPVDAFAPHGIDLSRDRRTLLVVNHGGREAVERFAVAQRNGAPTLTWTDCIPFDNGAMLNDVASLPDGGFLATQMVSQSAFAPLGLVLGLDTGRVWHWSAETGIRAIPGSEGNGPNGIAVSPDGETIFFAEWGQSQLIRLRRDGSDRREIPLGFHPDNLSWTADGRVLAGGQITGPIEATGCFELMEGGCSLASAVALVDPGMLGVRRILTHDPATAVGGVSSALARGDVIWLGAFGGDRIGWIPAD